MIARLWDDSKKKKKNKTECDSSASAVTVSFDDVPAGIMCDVPIQNGCIKDATNP